VLFYLLLRDRIRIEFALGFPVSQEVVLVLVKLSQVVQANSRRPMMKFLPHPSRILRRCRTVVVRVLCSLTPSPGRAALLHTVRLLLLAGVLLTAGTHARSPALPPDSGVPAGEARVEAGAHPTIGNPAAVYCNEMGYEYSLVEDGGQRGVCTLPDGEVCDAWAFLQGKCGQKHSYCAREGYGITTVNDGKGAFSPEYAVCVTDGGAVVGPLTELARLSEKATACGEEPARDDRLPIPAEMEAYVPSPDTTAPSSFDWRSYQGYNWLTPIRNQGGCGSCWAFSAVGVAEAVHNIAANNPSLDKDLSEQYLVADCHTYYSYQTCCGGSKSMALQFIRDSGVPDEGCMPYVDDDGCSCGDGSCANCTYNTGYECSDTTCSDRCGDWSGRLEYIYSTGYVSSDPQTIKQALVDRGPLAVSMGIGSPYGGYWDGDIYRCTDDGSTNHAVILVGYSDAGGYWWVRNSWGTGWGDGGYFKLGYGECHIEQYVYYADARPPSVGPLEYHSHVVDDDTSGGSSGNGDGVVNCGETIEIPLDLYNQGDDTATGVTANLSTSDGYVTITDGREDYPDIAGGGTGTCVYDFDFQVDSSTPHGHVIHFDLNLDASNGGPWTDSFQVPVSCGTVETVVINEVDLGDSDAFELYNPGSTAVDMTGWLFTGVRSGTVTNYTFPIFTLGAGSYVVVHESSGTDTSTDLYMDDNIYWVNEWEGSASLVDAGGQGVDFVRWDGSTDAPPAGTGWTGTDPESPPAGYNLGRNSSGTDTDDGSDWCGEVPTLGAQNGSCITNYPPYTPGSPSPADGGSGVSRSSDLIWSGGDPDSGDSVTYDVYFGTANPPTTLLCGDISGTTCDPGTLSYNARYYWYVVATDNHSASTTGPTWDFSTEPAACNDLHESNDTPGAATSIGYGTTLSDPNICAAGDVDYYAFTGSAGDLVVVDIDARTMNSTLDSYLHLYDTDGVSQLTYNDDHDDLDSYLEYILPADGTYYLMVRDFSHPNEGGTDYYYTLRLISYGYHVYLPNVLRDAP
jgi:putative hemolysin